MTSLVTSLAASRHRVHLGYLAALGAAFSYGAASLVARKIVDDYSSPMVGTAFSLLFGTMIVAALFHRDAVADAIVTPRRVWLFAVLAGCAATWGVSFWFLALNRAPVVLVAPLAGTHPLVAMVLTHIFLQRLERVTWHAVLGTLMIVGGVVFIAVGKG